MTARRIDRILLGLGALLILISSYQLFWGRSESSLGLKLGTLTSTLSIVKTKSALSLDWRDASIGHDLTENQLIYTDSKSSAEVVFTEGSVLEIGENSLIKLRAVGKEQSMDLSKGFIRAKLEGDKPLKVQVNGEEYLVSGNNADIQINIQNQKGEIGVLSGEVSVAHAGVTENLNPTSALEISGDKVSKKQIYFKTLLPEKSSILYTVNDPELVAFSWEPSEAAQIILSNKLSLEKAKTYNLSSGETLPLSPGLYYYKITGNSGTSLVNTFRIIQEKAPEVLRPDNGSEVFILEGEESRILLQWKHEERLKYQVEWNDGESKDAIVSGGSAFINVRPDHPLQWRVKISDAKRPEAMWTPWQSVKVTLIHKPLIPTDLIPHEVEYQTYEKPNEKVELSWKGQSHVELEIKNPEDKTTFLKVDGDSYDYIATTGGNYSWRVRAIDSHLRMSDWSDWKTFSIEDLSKSKGPEGIQRIQLKKPDQSVTFNWKAEDGTTSVFELSKDAQFRTIIKRIEVNKDSAQVSIPEVGSYYWRSRQYLPDGTMNVSEPTKVIIEPVPAPEKPEKLPDLEVPLEDLPIQTTFLERAFDFFLSSAYADEAKGIVKVDLPLREEAKGYVVKIYRDAELTDLVFEEQISGKHFEWKNAEAGVYYWQYAVIDYWDRQSLFSDPSILTIKHEGIPLPSMPKLLSPIRAAEVDPKELTFRFTTSDLNRSYIVEISSDETFKEILSKRESKTSDVSFTGIPLTPNLYYWRVRALNKKNKEVSSNTGRFTIIPPLEKTVIIDQAVPAPALPFQKEWKSRGFIAWAPSMDSYTFKDVATGKIDGNALMSALVSGTIFKDNYALNAELLRQTGEVFKGESYLFQRLLVDGVKTWDLNKSHKFGVGLAIGQSSGQAYQIQDSIVTAKSASGLNFGAIVRDYYSINETWEMQGKLAYLSGEITQMEFGADAIRHFKGYLLLGGVGYASREYKISSGKQTSMKVTLGFGKEF
jgi:hypothetical protein